MASCLALNCAYVVEKGPALALEQEKSFTFECWDAPSTNRQQLNADYYATWSNFSFKVTVMIR